MNLEELRNKFIDILQQRTGVGFDEKVTADKLLSIHIGGKVSAMKDNAKECACNKKLGHICCYHIGHRILTRPRLLKDCVVEER